MNKIRRKIKTNERMKEKRMRGRTERDTKGDQERENICLLDFLVYNFISPVCLIFVPLCLTLLKALLLYKHPTFVLLDFLELINRTRLN